MKRIICYWIAGILCLISVSAQDLQFSQFYAAPLYLGPSMTGVNDEPRLIVNYRDQWPKLSGRFTSQALSFDVFVKQYNSGVGLMLLHDNAGGGKIVTTQASFNYSYRLEVTKKFYVQPGLSAQYYRRSVNYKSMQYADQYFGSTVLPSTIENLPSGLHEHADFSSSLLAFGKNFWIGFTLDHMMKLSKTLQDNDQYLPLKTSFYGGYKYDIQQRTMTKVKKSIYVAYQFRTQNSINQLDIGIYYKQTPLMVGLWYRGVPVVNEIKSNDALIFLCGVEYKRFTFFYSYDFTISPLIAYSGGAHELSIAYKFMSKTKSRRHIGAIPCPKL